MSDKINKEIKDFITTLYEAGTSRKDIIAELKAYTGWGKTKAYEVYKAIVAEHICASWKDDTEQKLEEERERAKKIYESDEVKKYAFTYDEEPDQSELTAKHNLHLQAKKPEPIDKLTKRIEAMAEQYDEDEDKWTKNLEFKEAYVYNSDSDKYVFPSKKANSGNFVIAGSVIRSIQEAYTSGGCTITDLAKKHEIPRVFLTEVLSKLKVTHDSLPFTNEEILANDDDALVGDYLEKRKFALHQKIEKAQWKDVQADATKWQEFKLGKLDPFKAFLDTWQPPAYEPVKWNHKDNLYNHQRTFVASAFDWHIGAREEARYMWKGKEWNLDNAKKSVERYLAKVKLHIANDLAGFGKCVFVMGGDLYNSLTGYTSNGTQLNNEYSRDTQFEAAMNLLIYFIRGLLELFPEVECHFVRGNHGGTTDIPLAWALKNYFLPEDRLTKFEIDSCRTKPVRIGPVLMLIDHGASDQTKSLLPGNPKSKESYIQHLLLARPELLIGVKQKIFVQGDLHHYEQKEFADFEFFMFGALPWGSQYADTKNLHNRARQNCLIIGEDGVEQVLHIYVD